MKLRVAYSWSQGAQHNNSTTENVARVRTGKTGITRPPCKPMIILPVAWSISTSTWYAPALYSIRQRGHTAAITRYTPHPIDIEQLTEVLGFTHSNRMRDAHRQWVQMALDNGKVQREPQWSESIAVGRPEFLQSIQKKLHPNISGRRIILENGYYQLREEPAAYWAHFTAEKYALRPHETPINTKSRRI